MPRRPLHLESLEERAVPSHVPVIIENREYVTALYNDLLGRMPDQEGLSHWTGMLDRGANRDTVALGIINSLEFTRAFVSEGYSHYLDRSATPLEIDHWQDFLLTRGGDFDQYQALLMSSEEAFVKAGSSNRAWLETIYQKALGRAIDPEGLRNGLANLSGGVSRFTVALGIMRSVEADRLTAREFYLEFLNRSPDPVGFPGWWMQLNDGVKQQTVVSQFLASPEYVFLASHD